MLHDLEQDPRLFQQAELFRWLVKTDIRLAACLSMDMYKSAINENVDTGRGDGAINGDGGADGCSTKNPPDVEYDEGMTEANAASSIAGFDYINVSQTSSEPPRPGEISRKFTTDVFPERHLLMGITQRWATHIFEGGSAVGQNIGFVECALALACLAPSC